MTPLTPDSKPQLPRGVRLRHDEVRGSWVLLAPERVLKLDPIAVEILKSCTGDVTLATIIDDLAARFATDRDRIAQDVTRMLADLLDKKVLAV